MNKYASTFTDLTIRKKIRLQTTRFLKGEIDLSQLDSSYQAVIQSFAHNMNISLDPHLNFFKASQKIYDSLKKAFQNKLLWVVGVTDTTYKDKFTFSNIVVSTQVLKGILDPSRPINIEIDFKAAAQFTPRFTYSRQQTKPHPAGG